MMARKPRQPRMVARFVHLHPRLLISTCVGLGVVAALTQTDWRTPTKLLTGWNAGVTLYLILVYWLIAHDTVKEIRARAAIQDEGAFALLILTGAASIASLVAIVAELGNAQAGSGWHDLTVGMGTIVLSWLFMHTIFATHYAHEYYGERSDDQVGGLKFPGTQAPDYWDFLYFSFTIAVASQTSDVVLRSREVRRAALAQSVLSFYFNLAVLGLCINMAAGLLGS